MTTTALQARTLVPTLTVNDIRKSIQFYTGLGFTVSEEMKEEGEVQGVMLQAGDAVLGISQDDFAKGRDRVKGVGMRLYLETDQDIESLAGRAKESGIKLESGPGPLPWGPIGFTVSDPDGFRLTVSKPSER